MGQVSTTPNSVYSATSTVPNSRKTSAASIASSAISNAPLSVRQQDCLNRKCNRPLDFHKHSHLFDSKWNKDYSKMKPNNNKYFAGGKEYILPFGCERKGVKVDEKYENNDWLTKDWHNAYYAIDPEYVICILERGFRKAYHSLYGRGIYCYIDPIGALCLQANPANFPYKGQKYCILIQVRIDPKKYTTKNKIFNNNTYEVLDVQDESSIRPYALCLFPESVQLNALKTKISHVRSAPIIPIQSTSAIKPKKMITSKECSNGTCSRSLDLDANSQLFDRGFDHDFTNIKDTDAKYAGKIQYWRPCGSVRIGVKVKGKYENETWLDSTWHNAYHGTKPEYVTCILENGFKKSASGNYGPGVYCAPNPMVALSYAKTKGSTLIYKNKEYYVVIQVRVEPSKYKAACGNGLQDQYWLLDDEAGIRPYALCLFPKV